MKKSLLLGNALFFLSTACVFAQSLTIQVTDQQGNPLNDAVVELVQSNSFKSADASKVAVMDQINKRFVPGLLVISQGQPVSFPNSDNIRHHVYSFSKAKSFELKLYAGKPENPIIFDNHGVVLLGCNIHDSMVGNIYVANNEAKITDNNGLVHFDSETNFKEISIWHPLQQANPEQLQIVDIASLQVIENNIATIAITVDAPAPRDTFSDTFGAK